MVIVKVDANVGVPDGRLKEWDAPPGRPARLRVTVLAVPDTSLTVTVNWVDVPAFAVCEAGVASTAKSNGGGGATTVRMAVAWRVTPEAEPVTTMVYDPRGVPAEVEMRIQPPPAGIHVIPGPKPVTM